MANLVARNSSEAMVAPMVGLWQIMRLVGLWSLESGGRFIVGMFGRNLTSIAIKMF